MLPVYKELLKHKLEIMVYSGDVDAIVPVRAARTDLAASAHPPHLQAVDISTCSILLRPSCANIVCPRRGQRQRWSDVQGRVYCITR